MTECFDIDAIRAEVATWPTVTPEVKARIGVLLAPYRPEPIVLRPRRRTRRAASDET